MYVVYDLETTGLDPARSDIIQFAYAIFDDNNIILKAESLYFYYKGMSWDQSVADKTHRFSLDFLKQFEDKFEENKIKMFTVLCGNTVVGWNNTGFDDRFVTTWLARQGISGLYFGRSEDAMKFTRPIHKKPKFKLVEIGNLIGISEDNIREMASLWYNVPHDDMNAHNAMYDVTNTWFATIYCINKGYVNLSPVDASTLSDFNNLDSRTALNSIPNEWLNAHYCVGIRVFRNGKEHYFMTCDDYSKWKPSSYKSYEELPDKFKARLLPYTFIEENGVILYRYDNGTVLKYVTYSTSSTLTINVGDVSLPLTSIDFVNFLKTEIPEVAAAE